MLTLPKIDTHNALFAKKIDVKTIRKIDKIVQETGSAKWRVIDKLLSTSLGVKTANKLDLSKWLKV